MAQQMIAAISIHAPREGGDHNGLLRGIGKPAISIHAPREGGDLNGLSTTLIRLPFQSTPPARGATRQAGTTGDR